MNITDYNNISEAFYRIAAFRENWDTHGAEMFQEKDLDWARSVVEKLLDSSSLPVPSDILPSTYPTILVCWKALSSVPWVEIELRLNLRDRTPMLKIEWGGAYEEVYVPALGEIIEQARLLVDTKRTT